MGESLIFKEIYSLFFGLNKTNNQLLINSINKIS